MKKLFMFLAMAIFSSGCMAHAHTHTPTTTVRTPPPPTAVVVHRPPAPGPNCTWVRAHVAPAGHIAAHWVCGPRNHVWVSGTYVTVRINGIPTRRYVKGYYRHPHAPRVHRYHRHPHRPRRR